MTKRLAGDLDVARSLLKSANAAVVPGAAFGTSPFLRITFALASQKMERACARIAEALSTVE
jgi:aspartate aminotransferase